MKAKVLISSLFFLALLLMMAGCSTGNPQIPEPTETLPSSSPSSTTSPTITPKLTLAFPPSPTPIPTLPPDKALQLLKALQDETCQLPCYLGIIPGQTTLQDAKAMLAKLGGSYLGEYKRETDSTSDYTFTFDIGDQSSGEKLLSHSISLITDNNVVQVIIVGAGTLLEPSLEANEIYRIYLQNYSARQIFLQLGEPASLSVGRIERPNQRGADLIILYNKQNIAIDIYGDGQENNLCPKNKAVALYLTMLLSYPESTVNIYSDGRVHLTEQEIYPPIDKVFGVNARGFYNAVMADPATCFAPE